jgi:hypothetical protein
LFIGEQESILMKLATNPESQLSWLGIANFGEWRGKLNAFYPKVNPI